MNKLFLIVLIILIAGVAAGSIYVFKNKSSTTTEQISAQKTTGTNSKTYSLTEVQTHNNQSSCWSSINNKVYDLTSWINKHPGGPDKILSICGSDGSAAFNQQHEGERRPANELASYYIGELTSN